MKNVIKLFGIVAFAAVIGFSTAGCDTGSTSSGPGELLPAAKGKLTVTGLGAFNGKWAIVFDSSINDGGSKSVIGVQSITDESNALIKYVPISGGQVSIPLYTYTGGFENLTAYQGNGTASSVIVVIMNASSIRYFDLIDIEVDVITVKQVKVSKTFSGGNLTVDWGIAGDWQ